MIIQAYKEAFKKCDLIATPVSPFAAFKINSIKDPLQMYLEDIYTIPVNLAGVPAVSIPVGLSKEGKPMGFQLTGPQKQDVRVMQAAAAFEHANPQFTTLPTLVR